MRGTEELLIVIVIYNLRIEDSISFKSILNIADSFNSKLNVAIYDNSSIGQKVNDGYYNSLNISYHHDASNPGISKSYNKAAVLASQMELKWLLFLDHDTELPINSIENYVSSIVINPIPGIKVPKLILASGRLFSPSAFSFNRSRILKNISIGVHSFRRKTFVNSGILVSLDLFNRAGGYNENVKLDHSDTEFVKRVKKITQNFEVLNLNLLHDFSNDIVDLQKAKLRFESYVLDTKNCTRNGLFDALTLSINCFIRTGSLSLKYRDLSFLSIFIRKYMN